MFHRAATRAILCSGRLSSSSSSSFSSIPLSVRSFSASAATPSTPSSTPASNQRIAPLVSKPAQAVFKAAQKDAGKDTIEKVGKNLSEFIIALDKFPTLRNVASNPSLKPEDKKKKFETLFPKLNYHPVAAEILVYYLATGQGNKIKDLVKDYNKLVAFHRNEVNGVITTAEKLSPAQLTKVTSAIKAKLAPGENLVLQQKIDRSLMGGMILKVGTKAIDLSVASQIRKIDQAIRTV